MIKPRNEYPRPQFMRKNWINLNGEWDFSFEEDSFEYKIIVPYVYQSEMSGINVQTSHDVVWYRKKFLLPEDMQNKHIILHFGAVDYECSVWVNGSHVMDHAGGHISFEADITYALNTDENEIKLKVTDRTKDLEMPRGKQYWKEQSEGIFYTRTTGIWQTVWMEAVNDVYLKQVFLTPDLDNMAVEVNYEIAGREMACLETSIYMENQLMVSTIIHTQRASGVFKVLLDQQVLDEWNFQESLVWTPDNPKLFDIVFKIVEGENCLDHVESYFGMRKVSIEDGQFLLNNKPFYQKLLLDQGYWKESLLTAPDDTDFIRDINLAKEMGFNGVRKHQKIEDPRFLYHADKLGFLVWGEIAAAYVYSRKYVKRLTDEWMEEISRDYNHPCIVVWTPLNESWGVPNIKDKKEEQSHSAAMVYLTKSLDQTRPVISNDGWEHTCTDILTIHDYESDKMILQERYKTMENILSFKAAGKPLFAHGWSYQKQPVLVTEFGGISYKKGEMDGWGYSTAASDEDFTRRYYDVISPLLESALVQGFCYTELTDVEQEINGLCTCERQPKIDTKIIRGINEGTWTPENQPRGFA